MELETAFQTVTSNIRFGPGVTREVGMDLAELKVERVMLVIDPVLVPLPAGTAVQQALEDADIAFTVFDDVRVEPTDESFQAAIDAAIESDVDAFVAVGGGSTIDTAKAANLYSTYPADFLAYITAPAGEGRPVPGPCKPLIAVPTTAGTGSETTGVAIVDLAEIHVKTAVAHRHLKPTLGMLDPENLRSLPAAVAACTGLDVVSHALESYTALPFDRRPRPENPARRTTYQGSNPVSDVWALKALQMAAEFLCRAVVDPEDLHARGQMLLASAFAGFGFGNAGVHLPHAMSYPVAGMVGEFRPAGYATDHPLVPHGMAVVLHAPAVFRFTASACPERHLRAAAALGADVAGARNEDAGAILADRLIALMQRLDMPNGLAAVGYAAGDIPALVEGTLPQERITRIAPRPAGPDELASLFEASLKLW